jgi:hypothetical protein
MFFASRAATVRPRPTPPASARRPPRRQGGLYIDNAAQVVAPLSPLVEDDPEMRAALAASVEVNDLEELAKWPHLRAGGGR